MSSLFSRRNLQIGDVGIVHDGLGRRFTVTQTNQSKITYAYDPANLALDTETVQYDIDQNGTYEFERVLDRSRDTLNRNNGFQLKNGTTIETQASYAFSPSDGRLSEVSNPQIPNQLFTYQYFSNSDPLEKVTGPAHEVVNTYEPNRDVLDTKTNKAGTFERSKYDYIVNVIGQRTDLTAEFNLGGSHASNSGDIDWTYDSLGQVTSATTPGSAADRSYQYDAIGNRKETANNLTLPTSDNYTANALNQYSAIQEGSAGVSPAYDFDGNATSYPLPTAPNANSTLSWDAENRLIETQVGTSGLLVRNYYDAQSRRFAKTVGTATTLYLYDDWNVIAEYQRSAGVPPALSKTRLWGSDLSGPLQGAGGVGGLLSESHISNPQSPIFYPTYDGNGNISEYLTANGTVAAHFEYDPFGNTVVNTDTTGQFNYRFSTKPLEAETGLYYYGYRYYDPLTGRWPSRDPIEERGGVNLYGFVGNNGIDRLDRFGLATTTTGDGSQTSTYEDTLAPRCKCGLEEPPEYDKATSEPGERFTWEARFKDDDEHSPQCCEVHQEVKSNNGIFPPDAFPSGLQPDTFYEDRDKFGHRYGHRTRPYGSGDEDSDAYDDEDNTYFGSDEPRGFPGGTVLTFRLVVVNVCSGSNEIVHISNELTVTFRKKRNPGLSPRPPQLPSFPRPNPKI